MMRRLLTSLAALLAACSLSFAQVNLEEEFFSLPDTVSNEYLDSLKISVKTPNDYWMIGVYGGAAALVGDFNPIRTTGYLIKFPVYGISVVKYFTMFGMFPNMGLEFGVQQNYEGYQYKRNKETGYRPTDSGAYQLWMSVPEAFILSHFHYDIGEYFKIIGKLGIFGGYRTSITRTLDDYYKDSEYEQYVNSFRDYDLRWSYGVQAGLGFALMFNPIEIHLNFQFKWGWGSFWKPDYNSMGQYSPYYYRFAYPFDGALTFGVYYQLTPRFGHTKAQLRALARKMIQAQQETN